jgi:hypothetical protein
MVESKQLAIKLVALDYTGDNIGADLKLTIATSTTTQLSKTVKNGTNASFKDVFVFEGEVTPGQSSIPINVQILEKDTISDEGSGSGTFTVDFEASELQPYSLSVPVTAQGGDKGKTANFKLSFSAKFGFNFGKPLGFLSIDEFKKVLEQTITNEVSKRIDDEKFRQYIQAEINQLSEGYIDHPSPEGSGKHGQRFASLDDYFIAAVFRGIALAARAKGYDNAAQHMEHYLGNSGSYLTFSGTELCNEVTNVRSLVDKEKQSAIAAAQADNRSNVDFILEGAKKAGYIEKIHSENWYYAVGGHTYWYSANVKTGLRTLDITVHFSDAYNWDKYKNTNILGINFPDKVLGRMHQAGIAYEFPMGGSVSFTNVKY